MKVKLWTPNLSLALRCLSSVALVFCCCSVALAQTEASLGSTASAGASAKQVSQTAAKGNDRLDILRAQIASAKTGDERMRLQRMLVDYLVALNRKGEAVNELR